MKYLLLVTLLTLSCSTAQVSHKYLCGVDRSHFPYVGMFIVHITASSLEEANDIIHKRYPDAKHFACSEYDR